MRWLIALLAFLVLVLQTRLWIGEGSFGETWSLQQKIKEQLIETQVLEERNKHLRAEVIQLKSGLEAVEERARIDLGMIKKGETFFLVMDKKGEPL
jgi:cell division protein FtsB